MTKCKPTCSRIEYKSALKLRSRPTQSSHAGLTTTTLSATVSIVDSILFPNYGTADLPVEFDFDVRKNISLAPPFREAEVDG